jgi:beta-glucosidase
LWVKKQLGLLDQPMPNFASYTKFASQEHKNAALNTALESITLLKNDSDLLPLKSDAKILVCGPAANSLNVINGAWTHTWQGVDTTYNTRGAKTILQALREQGTGQIDYVLGCDLDSVINIDLALSKARNAEVIVICLGEIPSTEKPGDIEDLNLPAAQIKLVREMSKLNKPIVLTFSFNRPMIVREIEPLAHAIVHTYLPGDYGGEALAKILFGEANPSGKLPFTYPRHTGSLLFYDHKHTELLDKDFGYNTFNPQWEFGFGLSYSLFEYSNLRLNKTSFSVNETIEVSITVKNASSVTGKEVVQVFVSDLVASITPSVQRLRGFEKINLEPGESKTVKIQIPVQDLAFVGTENRWLAEPGEFTLKIKEFSEKFEIK